MAGAIYYFSASDSKNNKPQNSVVASQNIIQNEVKENPIQKNQAEISHPLSVIGENSSKEKTVVTAAPENKTASTEKTETQETKNITENKSNNPQQVQPSNISSPKATFHADMNKVCEGSSVQFTSDNNEVECTYHWNFGDGETSMEQNPKHIYNTAGNYSVKLLVASIKDKKSDEQKNTITVSPAPEVKMNFSASDDNSLSVNFDANAENITEWKWNFGDKQNADEQNPAHTYNKKGNYQVSVTAKNSFGCITTAKQNVNVEYNLLAPTGFSPNGDGLNDTWIPKALLVGDQIFTLTIYNKSGNPVCTITDKIHPWEGQNTHVGDTFIWKAVVKDKNGEESNYKGLITIAP